MNYQLPEWYRLERAEFDREVAVAKYEPDEDQSSTSPSGQHVLRVERTLVRPHVEYARGTVLRVADGNVVAVIYRNYSLFWHAWVDQGERRFLLCGEDYQGYSVVDLDQAKINTYIPEEAKDGHGFCWVKVVPSPSGRLLAVEGCYWACPYNVRVHDFSAPDALPLPLLKDFRAEPNATESDFVRWVDDETAEVKVGFRERDDGVGERTSVVTWRR